MKRVTVEDGLHRMPNQFELAVLGAKSAHELIQSERILVESDSLAIALALKEKKPSGRCSIRVGFCRQNHYWQYTIRIQVLSVGARFLSPRFKEMAKNA